MQEGRHAFAFDAIVKGEQGLVVIGVKVAVAKEHVRRQPPGSHARERVADRRQPRTRRPLQPAQLHACTKEAHLKVQSPKTCC